MEPDREDARIERKSDIELVVTRSFKAPARRVFEAWARPELFKIWWAPASFGMVIVGFEADVRTGGTYRLEMGHSSSNETMVFFGRYLEVVFGERIVWTNDEGGEAGPVTTVTFQQNGNLTLVTIHDLYPSKEALDEAVGSGSTSCWDEQMRQLDASLIEASTDR